MKLIKAIIRPDKLQDVLHALYETGVHGLTVTRVQGHGGEPEVTETYRGAKRTRELTDKITLDIAVSDAFVESTVDTITEAARTGEVGDGKVFVQPLEAAYRIRTGERDEQAVTPEGTE